MSGGSFGYIQYRFSEIIEKIEKQIRENKSKSDPEVWYTPNNFSEETIEELKTGIELLKKAQIYTQRIDWLLSYDDSETTFHKRLSDDLRENGLLNEHKK